MIITETVEIKIHNTMIKYYEGLGYEIPRVPAKYNKNKMIVSPNTTLLVKVSDLPLKSNVVVDVKCDYCGDIVQKQLSDINQGRVVVEKDCCNKCKPLKIKETNLIKFGVEHKMQLDETKEKLKQTNMERYGFEHSTQRQEVKDKVAKTNLERYGAIAPAQNKDIKEKMKNTNIDRYGYISPTLNEEVRQKQIDSLIVNYGVEYPQQSKIIKEKSMSILYKNKTAPCSRQQAHIHNLIGGELNYPHGNSFLDIALLEEKIYIEVDLGGHELQVKLGNISKEKYEIKERNRWYALYRKGWKEVRIISSKDKIPTDKKIVEMIDYAKEYLNTGRHHIKFYLDDNKVVTSQFEKEYDFGDLRYIYKEKQTI